MTFSRPAIERLITTVESGLQYGELGPYASALKECLGEIKFLRAETERLADEDAERYRLRAEVASLTAERLGAVCEIDQLRKQVEALTETIGTERNCARLQQRLRVAHEERDAMREQLDALRDECREAGR